MRKMEGFWKTRLFGTGKAQSRRVLKDGIVKAIRVVFSLYCLWETLFSVSALEKRLTVFVAFILVMGYLSFPSGQRQAEKMIWYDWIWMTAGAIAFLWYAFRYDSLVQVLSSASKLTNPQIIIGIVGIVSLMELCRRCVGWPILIITAVLMIYTCMTGKPLRVLVFNLFYDMKGILSSPLKACANYICIFIIFGAFLERGGIAEYFISLANSLVGRFAGGPAKVAVLSSALCGMVSGSSVGNTVTTGSVTIPMMKEIGYRPEFAAAVEASASTGGQIMPPIMGAAAFLMAEYLGIGYGEITLRALLPAALYFTGIFISVHLEAKKNNLRGIPKENLPSLKTLLPRIYLLFPMVLLIWLVSSKKHTMAYSAVLAILAVILVDYFDRVFFVRENGKECIKKTGKSILYALEHGAKGMVSVAVACCMAGMISGCIVTTGLASKLTQGVVRLHNSVQIINPAFVALFLTMLCCIVLGMGVPTTANYCIMASTCAPILIAVGIPKIAAHFFVFYFGIVADITPPVALAAYAGAAIAKSNPLKTGAEATKLAIGAFLVPYIFCLDPAMLLLDTSPVRFLQIIGTAFIGIFGVAAAINGFLKHPMNLLKRAIIGIGGVLMMIPSLLTDLFGIFLVSIVTLTQYLGGSEREGIRPK